MKSMTISIALEFTNSAESSSTSSYSVVILHPFNTLYYYTWHTYTCLFKALIEASFTSIYFLLYIFYIECVQFILKCSRDQCESHLSIIAYLIDRKLYFLPDYSS